MVDHDDLITTIQDGQAARMIRGDFEDHLIGREDDIITMLCNAYTADTLTNDKLRGSIGEIAGLRNFRRELEAKVRRGTAAAEAQLGVNKDG